MSDDAARVLRETLEQMANACSVDMELWDKHANAVLTAAARIEALVGENADLRETLKMSLEDDRESFAAMVELTAKAREAAARAALWPRKRSPTIAKSIR